MEPDPTICCDADPNTDRICKLMRNRIRNIEARGRVQRRRGVYWPPAVLPQVLNVGQEGVAEMAAFGAQDHCFPLISVHYT